MLAGKWRVVPGAEEKHSSGMSVILQCAALVVPNALAAL